MDQDPARDPRGGDPAPEPAPWELDDEWWRGERESAPAPVRRPLAAPLRPGLATAAILAVLAVVHAIGVAVALGIGGGSVVDAHALAGRIGLDAASVVGDGELWRLLTAPFVHGQLLELLIVLSLVLSFGPLLERAVGALRMLTLVFGLALVVELTHLGLTMGDPGAAGGFHGLLGPALAVPILAMLVAPRRPMLLFDLVPLRVGVLVAVSVGVAGTVFLGVVGEARYEAHLIAVPLAPAALVIAAFWDHARTRRSIAREAGRTQRDALAVLRVEALLRKISADGMESLSGEEVRFLVKASSVYRRRVRVRSERIGPLSDPASPTS